MVKITDKYGKEVSIKYFNKLPNREMEGSRCDLEPGDVLVGDEFAKVRTQYKYGEARYRIVRRIGQGAQGQIYLAETMGDELMKTPTRKRIKLPKRVVVKGFEFSPMKCATSLKSIDTKFRNVQGLGGYGYQDWYAFRRERNVLRDELNLLYPGEFLRLYDTTCMLMNEDGKYLRLPFLGTVMDYFESKTLEERLREGNKFDKERTAEELLKKMMAIQSILVVHRDIKLPNILVNDEGLPQIIDYSLHTYTTFAQIKNIEKESRAAVVNNLKLNDEDYSFDVIKSFLGNRLFAPPEIYQNRIDRRYDNWSLGIVLYAMFTGEHLVPVGYEKTLDLREPVSLHWKRRYSSFLRKVAGNHSSKRKLQRVLDGRIVDSSVPERFKPVIRALSMVNAGERPYLRKVLAMTGIKPYEPRHSAQVKDFLKFHIGGFWHRELNFY